MIRKKFWTQLIIFALSCALYGSLAIAQGQEEIQYAVLIKTPLSDPETDWLQGAVEQVLLGKLGNLPGLEVNAWIPPPDQTEEEILLAIKERGNRWALRPSAVSLEDRLEVVVRLDDVATGQRLEDVSASASRRRLISVLQSTLQDTMNALGIQAEIDFGTRSNLALEKYLRGNIHWQFREYEKAINNFETSLRSDELFQAARTALANAWYDIGLVRYSEGNLEEAIQAFQKAAENYKTLDDQESESHSLARLHHCQGLILWGEGDQEGARAEFEKALELNENLSIARSALAGADYNIGKNYEDGEQWELAREKYESAANNYAIIPDLGNAAGCFACAARCAEKMGDLEKAAELLLQSASLYTNWGDYAAARAVLAADTPSGLVEALEKAPKTKQAEAHLLLGVGYMRSGGQYESAVKEFRQAVSLNPESLEAHLLLGRTYLLTERPNKKALAIIQFQLAKELDPESAEARVYLGDAYYQANMYKEAETELLLACQLLSEEDIGLTNKAYSTFARVQVALKKYEEAVEAYSKALEMLPFDAPSWLGRATALYHLERFSEAKQDLEMAKKYAPGMPGIEILERRLALKIEE